MLGPNGAGKTTTFYMVVGIISPDAGQITFDNQDITYTPIHVRARFGIGYLSQEPSVFRKLTVEENIMAILETLPLRRIERLRRLDELLEELRISHLRKSKAYTLSGGETRRLEITRALVTNPSFFLLDEPLSNLDAGLRGRMRREIVRIQRELSCTTVYVTHDQEEALTMADRIALLKDGRILQIGTPQELYASPNCRYVAEFIGSPGINMIECSVFGSSLQPFGFPLPSRSLPSGDKILVGIRPEAVEIKANESQTLENAGARGQVAIPPGQGIADWPQ